MKEWPDKNAAGDEEARDSGALGLEMQPREYRERLLFDRCWNPSRHDFIIPAHLRR